MKLSEELYEMAKTYAHNIKGSYLKLSSLEAEQLKERIQELEAQIEKMKSCGNCKFEYTDECRSFSCYGRSYVHWEFRE